MAKHDNMREFNLQRSKEKEKRAIEAMRKMFELKVPITIGELVKETGLSRGFYYKNETVSIELRRLQQLQEGIDFYKPRRIALDTAMEKRIQELEKENIILRGQISKLRERNSKLEKAYRKRKEDYFNEI